MISHYIYIYMYIYFFYPYFNVIVVVSILPVSIWFTLNDLETELNLKRLAKQNLYKEILWIDKGSNMMEYDGINSMEKTFFFSQHSVNSDVSVPIV